MSRVQHAGRNDVPASEVASAGATCGTRAFLRRCAKSDVRPRLYGRVPMGAAMTSALSAECFPRPGGGDRPPQSWCLAQAWTGGRPPLHHDLDDTRGPRMATFPALGRSEVGDAKSLAVRSRRDRRSYRLNSLDGKERRILISHAPA
jgi:hypothetical protein